MSDPIEIRLRYKTETAGAWVFKDADGNDVVLPKSQVDVADLIEPDPGDVVTVEMPEWLAKNRGLI